MRLSKEYVLIIIAYILLGINIYRRYILMDVILLIIVPAIFIGFLIKKIKEKDNQIQYQTNQLSELGRKIEHSQYLAHYDMTTGLANRVKMNHYFESWIDNNLTDQKMAVLFMDIDKFKAVNDKNGHKFGDEFLRKFAERLEGCIKQYGEVYRYAGDEFVALMPYENYNEIEERVSLFLNHCSMPFDIVDKKIQVTSSVGISLYPEHSRDINELLDYADRAMYQGKNHGRGVFVLYK